jgi:hypothetical protein
VEWSSDVPTVEGWYWFVDTRRGEYEPPPRPVFVEEDGSIWLHDDTAFYGREGGGAWLFLGPITPAVAPPSASNEKDGA